MKFYSANQIAKIWGVSGQFVRRYCKEGKISEAVFENGIWLIPEGTDKPGSPIITRTVEMSPLLKKVLYQQERNNHYGIYEYIQLNTSYSSNRMASKRLKRQQVEMIYRKNRIDPGFEPVKIDDILEVINHLAAMDFVIRTALDPLTSDYVKMLHYLLTYGAFADADRRQYLEIGTYRAKAPGLYKETAAVPNQVAKGVNQLVMTYEKVSSTVSAEQPIIEEWLCWMKIHPFSQIPSCRNRNAFKTRWILASYLNVAVRLIHADCK